MNSRRWILILVLIITPLFINAQPRNPRNPNPLGLPGLTMLAAAGIGMAALFQKKKKDDNNDNPQ